VAGAGVAASGLGTLLTSCGLGSAAPKRFSPLPDPQHPIMWPITTANKPIAGGQLPETNATLKVFSWAGRVSHRCLRDFAKAYLCRVELTTYSSMTQALARLSHGGDQFDVFMGAPTYLIGTLVGRSVIQPLNHGYIPNISEAWPVYTDPYYDSHWQYTVPYTAYTTGIAWRKDHIDIDPYALSNGWEFPWLANAAGKTAILNDYRESISLGLLKNFVTDVNSSDPLVINNARDALLSLNSPVGLKIDNNVGAQLATAQSWIHLAWSGQAVAATKRLPRGVPAEVIGYWFPPSGRGPVANDTNTVLRGARNPVLAHLFVNFMLDRHNAMRNMAATGFTMPLTYASAARLIHEGILPPSLTSAAVLSTSWDHGLKELQFLPAINMLWLQAWQAVRRDSSHTAS
jgi:spermidine/putrescine transport system substrate-binding protein